jgi:hypothetical protein
MPLLVEQLRKAWRARETAPIDEVLRYEAGALVLGAGTVMTMTEGGADTPQSGEARLAALLAVAYGQRISGESLSHLKAAAARWTQGDEARAKLHVALARLGPLARPKEDARRLFMADGLMRAGIAPSVILDTIEAETLKYSPDQPRIPPGSGRPSGQWTSTGAGDSNAAEPCSSPVFPMASPMGVGRGLASAAAGAVGTAGRLGASLDLGAMTAAGLRALAGFVIAAATPAVVAVGGSLAVAGVLFIPIGGPKGKWVHVGGPGDVSYYHNPDEAAILLRYTTRDGTERTTSLLPGPNGEYRDPNGRVLARIVRAVAKTGVLVSIAELEGNDNDDPRICPHFGYFGGGGGLRYEQYMKGRFNPKNPTPAGLEYAFLAPTQTGIVRVDDCQQQTGALAEYKGPGFERHFLKRDFIWDQMLKSMMSQAKNQTDGKGDRPLTWFFEEKSVADYMRGQFKDQDLHIKVRWVPLPRGYK